jgi:hypothetical protein
VAQLIVIICLPIMLCAPRTEVKLLLGHDGSHYLKRLLLLREINRHFYPLKLRVKPQTAILIHRQGEGFIPRVLVALGPTHYSASLMSFTDNGASAKADTCGLPGIIWRSEHQIQLPRE